MRGSGVAIRFRRAMGMMDKTGQARPPLWMSRHVQTLCDHAAKFFEGVVAFFCVALGVLPDIDSLADRFGGVGILGSSVDPS